MKVKTGLKAGISCTPPQAVATIDCNGGWPIGGVTGDSGGTLN
jgi:hypothetical protein